MKISRIPIPQNMLEWLVMKQILKISYCAVNIKPFKPIVLFLYPLITSENQRFPDVFRGNGNETLCQMVLKGYWKFSGS